MIDTAFWKGRRVFLSGHTGFKGSWLSIWLHRMGALVLGYALDPPTKPSLYDLCRVGRLLDSRIADIRDAGRLARAMRAARPEVAFHLAAQPLVRRSYQEPLETYSTNVMGTANFLEAARRCPGVRSIVVVTTDKCYENQERLRPFQENEPLGGHDPYSSSKACAELVAAAYRRSFFSGEHGIALATARAGNVIGGGDWAEDRLAPDCFRALLKGERVLIRSPRSLRPWQHVLEPLGGYLLLAERLYKGGAEYAEAWNFGPRASDAKPVKWVVGEICRGWGAGAGRSPLARPRRRSGKPERAGAAFKLDKGKHLHEAHRLMLDCSKAKTRLGWGPRWDLSKAIDRTVVWTKAYSRGEDLLEVCESQIDEYLRG
ncbi:MAG: CDP-glucose 4,6-dehydratase [Elusimicrobia bacterium]|nr:CDP-glucose 4,6-dehydratase [Elusimicrobiota bacterium]